MERNDTIGHKICKKRKAAGMTQKELADKVGCTLYWISKVERGHYSVSNSLLRKICDELGMEMSITIVDKSQR